MVRIVGRVVEELEDGGGASGGGPARLPPSPSDPPPESDSEERTLETSPRCTPPASPDPLLPRDPAGGTTVSCLSMSIESLLMEEEERE